MGKKFEIGYLTECPAKEYAEDIRKALTPAGLVKAIAYYGRVADNALAQAQAIKPKEFGTFKKHLKMAEKKQSEAWMEKFDAEYGEIAMPTKMMMAYILADRFKVPWGSAFIRSEQEGWPMLRKNKQPTVC